MAMLFAMYFSVSSAWAITMEEACGNASESLASHSPGRWLPWTEDHLDQEGLDVGLIRSQHRLLTQLAEPFMELKVLSPPPGVEARPHRSIGDKQQMGEPEPGAKLMIQIFHPTYKQAGEASAGVKVFINNLLPIFYGIGGGEIKDDMGSMFAEPVRVGELGGADVYWSGRPRDCIAVFKGNQKPLWTSVSQERYLRAQISQVEKQIADARSEYEAERREQAAKSTGPDLAEQEEMLKQMRAINPEAAKDMEKQLESMRRMMEEKMPEMQKNADSAFDRMGDMLTPQINKFKDEIAAMTPAERAAPAYLGGQHGSRATLLSQPKDPGARPLVAPVKDYFSKGSKRADAQLLIVEFASYANHAPETAIITRLRKEVDWHQFWRFVGK